MTFDFYGYKKFVSLNVKDFMYNSISVKLNCRKFRTIKTQRRLLKHF